ncbi:MAG: hypothetical protein ACXAAR_06260 [Candidatus Thorarchaeota archaeon]|jgi:hypothetical protein
MSVVKILPDDLIGEFYAVGSVSDKSHDAPLEYTSKLKIPYAFTLPKLQEEDMIRQFAALVPEFERDGNLTQNIDLHTFRQVTEDDEPLLPHEKNFGSLFQIVGKGKFAYFKTQQTAPASMCFSTRDKTGKQLISKSMFHFYASLMKRIAEGQRRHLNNHCDRLILCQDDPALGFVIEIINRGDISNLTLKHIVKVTDRTYPKDVIPSYHYCDDWRNLSTNGWHVIWSNRPKVAHLDVLAYPPKTDNEQAEMINKFLERGGGIALGVLPNRDDAFQGKVPDVLHHNLMVTLQAFHESGVSLDLLKPRCMVSTQCGLYAASESLSRSIHLESSQFSAIYSEA